MAGWNYLSIDEIRKISLKKKLKPGRVKGSNVIQLTNTLNPRVEIIDWDEFEKELKKRKLVVGEYNGFMKIMKK